MNKFLFFIGILLLVMLFSGTIVTAQTLPVGTVSEDVYRREQLLGHIDSNISFTVRPLTSAALKNENIFDADKSLKTNSPNSDHGIFKFADGKGIFQVLPITLIQQYNTHNPYGWNDGSMIPAAGYQTLFNAGIYLRYKFLSIQLQPEFLYAQNKNFDGFTQAGNETAVWTAYYGVHNYTDLPERFGSTYYSQLLPGQSSVRLTFDPVSFGLSTENLWWGPGIHNSLIMSDNATGFAHLTLNTTRPVITPVGSFEAQLIGGKLLNSGYAPLVPGQAGNYDYLVKPKTDDWRYLSGLVFTYHPKWIPDFFLGITRVLQQYSNDVTHNFKGYFPVFSSYVKSSFDTSTGNTANQINQDQLTSVFARWLWTRENAEIYFEYGRNDFSYDLRDLFLDPEHSRAYIFGLRKIFKLSKPDQYIQAGLEVTQLAQSADDIVERSAGNWYTHGKITQGYTNNGEVIGAGIGPGGSLQTLEVNWFSGMKKLGLQIDRFEHDMDLYHKIPKDSRRHWVDLSMGLHGDWDYSQFIFSAKLVYVDQLNYEWKFDEAKAVNFNYPRYDANNFQFGLSVAYRL